MKPTTKLQHEVFTISKTLSSLTENQHKSAVKNIFSKYGTTSHKTFFCLECSHNWKDAEVFKQAPKHLICPSCQIKIQILSCSSEYQSNAYFTKIDTKDNFQIVRIFFMEKLMKKGTIPMYYTTEVIQHFIGLNGRVTSLAMPTTAITMYYDNWRKSGDMSIMANDFLNSNRGRIEGFYTLPRATFLKEITRNGFYGNYYDIAPQNLFSLLMKPQAETLIKANQIDLFKNFNSIESQIKKHWNSIKICIRNNYKIEDATIWLDYMKLLEEFGKDLLSTKYVCPTDLHKAHDKLVDKQQKINAKIEEQKMLEDLKDKEVKYKKDKSKFLGMKFTNGTIEIKILQSVYDFYIEGKELKHCVFGENYYGKKDKLVFSATKDEKRIETIEFSLKQMKIIQARGLQNKASQYNKEIKSLVMDNLYQIQQINNLKSA